METLYLQSVIQRPDLYIPCFQPQASSLKIRNGSDVWVDGIPLSLDLGGWCCGRLETACLDLTDSKMNLTNHPWDLAHFQHLKTLKLKVAKPMAVLVLPPTCELHLELRSMREVSAGVWRSCAPQLLSVHRQSTHR